MVVPDVLPACCCAFSPDSRLLLLGTLAGVIQAISLDAEANIAGAARMVHTFRGKIAGGDGTAAAIIRLAVSDDAQWLASTDTGCATPPALFSSLIPSSVFPATQSFLLSLPPPSPSSPFLAGHTAAVHVSWLSSASHADGQIEVYSIDTASYRVSLPPFSAPPTAIGFLPHSESLVVALANKQVRMHQLSLFWHVPIAPSRVCLAPHTSFPAVSYHESCRQPGESFKLRTCPLNLHM